MARTPVVDQEEGISCGLCGEACPEVFRLNDLEVAEVYNPSGTPEEKIQEVIDGCPGQGIPWE